MLAFIRFSPQFAAWSAFTFWMVVLSIIVTLGFTFVVFVCGLSDLRFLLESMQRDQGSDEMTSGDEADV